MNATSKPLRRLTYGLYVLTARHEERVAGGTVTWVGQVSANPPLLSVALKESAGVAVLARESRRFALHVLADGQHQIARAFFEPVRLESGLINGLAFHEGAGRVPLLDDAPCVFECEVDDVQQPGDHLLLLGRVATIHERDHRAPLTLGAAGWYYDG